MSRRNPSVTDRRKIYLFLKRLIDIVGSVIVLVFFSPLMLLIAIMIKIESPGPVLFRQRRIGKGKKEFIILKFRSMKNDAPNEVPTHLFDKPNVYITKIGKFIRKTSIDELPQFINVLKGEMSLVGPRPALWNQVDLIEERDKFGVNEIMPGISGWAQINGRDYITNEIKVKYDAVYAENASISIDVVCILRTLVNVITKKNIKG